MEMRHLELLRALSVRGTLTAVAEATHRTQSAVSQQLRSAERELGVALVEPVGRGVRLTSEGQLLADSADEVLEALAQVEARLEAARREPRGRVSIGTLPSAGTVLLPALIEQLALRAPGIDLDLDDFDLAEADYASRTLDVDIVIGHSLTGDVPAGAEALATQVLAREPIDVAMPAHHPLAGRASLHPRDLRDTTWIGVPPGYPFDSILIAVEHMIEAPLERRIRLRDNRLIESLVRAGVGLALLPRFSTAPTPGVQLVPLDGVRSRRAVVAMSRRDRAARQAVRTVLDTLADVGADLSRDTIAGPRPRQPTGSSRGTP